MVYLFISIREYCFIDITFFCTGINHGYIDITELITGLESRYMVIFAQPSAYRKLSIIPSEIAETEITISR